MTYFYIYQQGMCAFDLIIIAEEYLFKDEWNLLKPVLLLLLTFENY